MRMQDNLCDEGLEVHKNNTIQWKQPHQVSMQGKSPDISLLQAHSIELYQSVSLKVSANVSQFMREKVMLGA